MEDSIFTKIIKGEIPCHKIYEDAHTLAFLDIHPASEGHALVVPKKQIEFVWQLDDETYRSLMDTVKKIANKMREVYPERFVGELIVGVDVPHAHVHLVPFLEAKELQLSFDRPLGDPDHAQLGAVAEKLRII